MSQNNVINLDFPDSILPKKQSTEDLRLHQNYDAV